ncbi:hypothetical protein ABK040_006074 [Willaertia magna]
MMRKLFTSSSSTEDDLLDSVEGFEPRRGSALSEDSSSPNHNHEKLEVEDNENSSPITSNSTSNNYYYDTFNKLALSKTHLNKITGLVNDKSNKNDAFYTCGFDGITCRWRLKQHDINQMELDFLYEKVHHGSILSICLEGELLFTGGDDCQLCCYYIHSEKALAKIKLNSPITSIYSFDYMANDFNIVGSVVVGLRNGEMNMFNIQKTYNKFGKWIGLNLNPNEIFNKKNVTKHERQINYITSCSSKEIFKDMIDNSIILSCGNDCYLKVWSPSTGEILFSKQFEAPCTKVETLLKEGVDGVSRFFFISHYSDISIFEMNTKKSSDYRVHFNINQFFLFTCHSPLDVNNLSIQSFKRRDRGNSLTREKILTSQRRITNNENNEIVSTDGSAYLIGWNSMRGRIEIWIYNLNDSKQKPFLLNSIKLFDIIFLQNLTFAKYDVAYTTEDILNNLTIFYTCSKKVYGLNVDIKRPINAKQLTSFSLKNKTK